MLDEPSEHTLQKRVLDHLKVVGRRDIYAFAVPNAARRSLRHGARMKAEGLKRGVADVCVMFPEGIASWLEFKTLRGRQSDHQMGFEAICGRLGHRYAVVRTFDEAIEVLRSWGALRVKSVSGL
jgi:hypothetical protein